jgi:hypothetical protein
MSGRARAKSFHHSRCMFIYLSAELMPKYRR